MSAPLEQDIGAARELLAAEGPALARRAQEALDAFCGVGGRAVYSQEQLCALQRAADAPPVPDALQRALRAAGVLKGALPSQGEKWAARASAKERKVFAKDVMGALRTADVVLSGPGDFTAMLLHPDILDGLYAAGYAKPTPIQWKAIPIGRTGVDLLAQAKSGTGKTCVFCVLAIETALARSHLPAAALILAPTREIASQIAEEGNQLAQFIQPPVEFAAFIGGTSVADDSLRLDQPGRCNIVVGTPGRLAQLMREGFLDLKATNLLVLDEADNLLGSNMQDTVFELASAMPDTKQVCSFSATYNVDLIRALADFMKSPQVVNLCASDDEQLDPDDIEGVVLDGVRQSKVLITAPVEDVLDKVPYAIQVLQQNEFSQAIVFSGQKTAASKIASLIRRAGFGASFVNGDESQASRTAAVEALRNHAIRVLVASDLISRGVDFPECSLVISLDIPRDPATYLHRVGRSGRFGGEGHAVVIVSEVDQLEVNHLQLLESKMGFALEPLNLTGSDCDTDETAVDQVSLGTQAPHTFYCALEEESYVDGKRQGYNAGFAAASQIIARLFPSQHEISPAQ